MVDGHADPSTFTYSCSCAARKTLQALTPYTYCILPRPRYPMPTAWITNLGLCNALQHPLATCVRTDSRSPYPSRYFLRLSLFASFSRSVSQSPRTHNYRHCLHVPSHSLRRAHQGPTPKPTNIGTPGLICALSRASPFPYPTPLIATVQNLELALFSTYSSLQRVFTAQMPVPREDN